MFHFGTTHNQERRDGFVSFRCFLWLGGGGKRTGTGIGEEGRGIGGWERTLRGGERTKRTEEDGEDFEVGGKRDSERERKQGLGERRNKTLRSGKRDLEKNGNGTLRRRKKGIGNHVIL